MHRIGMAVAAGLALAGTAIAAPLPIIDFGETSDSPTWNRPNGSGDVEPFTVEFDAFEFTVNQDVTATIQSFQDFNGWIFLYEFSDPGLFDSGSPLLGLVADDAASPPPIGDPSLFPGLDYSEITYTFDSNLYYVLVTSGTGPADGGEFITRIVPGPGTASGAIAGLAALCCLRRRVD